jgi:hypothetical protein
MIKQTDYLFAILTCLVFVLSSTSTFGQSSTDYFIAKGFNVPDGAKLFFGTKTKESIGKLKYHENLKVSLYAAWIDCNNKVTALASGTKESKIALRKEFISFVSGRLNSPIPDWWQREIEVVQLDPNFDFLGASHMKHSSFVYENPVNHLTTIELLELTDSLIRVKVGMEVHDIKWDKDDYWNRGEYKLDTVKCVAFSTVEYGGYVYAVADKENVLIVRDNKNGDELWRALLDSQSQIRVTDMGAWPNNYLEILESNGLINVFGANRYGLFVRSFDKKTGDVVSDFTTNFYLKPK